MLSKIDALNLVSEKLEEMAPDEALVVVDKNTIERSFGWVFFYNSRRFVETGALRYRLAGNGPVVVNKNTNEIRFLGTNKPVEQIILEYEMAVPSENS